MVHDRGTGETPRDVLHLPTKGQQCEPSRLKHIAAGAYERLRARGRAGRRIRVVGDESAEPRSGDRVYGPTTEGESKKGE